MEIKADTATKLITVQGVKVSVPQPYTEGHVLTENEANALNQVLAENLRNNQASQMRKVKDQCEKDGTEYKPDPEAVQKEMDEYVTEYEFGVRKAGAASTAHLDPVEKEMQTMAKNAIKTALQSKGYKLKDVPAETMENLVAQYFTSNEESLRVNAEQVVKAREAVAGVSLDLDSI